MHAVTSQAHERADVDAMTSHNGAKCENVKTVWFECDDVIQGVLPGPMTSQADIYNV
jgi:hypothetical protein